MNNIIKKELIVTGSGGRPMLTDITFDERGSKCPVLLYAHGFNGFKDWGNFDLIATQFARAGFTFVKFNFSHNGTTPESPEDFTDLEAFAENNYTKELYDLSRVLDWITDPSNPFAGYINAEATGLIGHSMGGGIAIIATAEDKRIKALATWAAIASCTTPWTHWPEEKIAEWKDKGVQYYLNGRTKQLMPMHYQLHEDYLKHRERLDILKAAARIAVPFLICHGTADSSVPAVSAYSIHQANPAAELMLIGSDHVFGRKHPWIETDLPHAMQEVTDRCITFFGECLCAPGGNAV